MASSGKGVGAAKGPADAAGHSDIGRDDSHHGPHPRGAGQREERVGSTLEGGGARRSALRTGGSGERSLSPSKRVKIGEREEQGKRGGEADGGGEGREEGNEGERGRKGSTMVGVGKLGKILDEDMNALDVSYCVSCCRVLEARCKTLVYSGAVVVR